MIGLSKKMGGSMNEFFFREEYSQKKTNNLQSIHLIMDLVGALATRKSPRDQIVGE